jgi:hypothetical protein
MNNKLGFRLSPWTDGDSFLPKLLYLNFDVFIIVFAQVFYRLSILNQLDYFLNSLPHFLVFID